MIAAPAGAFRPDRLGALPEADEVFVVSLRLWVESLAGQEEVWRVFSLRYGTAHGACALRAFEGYLLALANAATRPLLRHPPCCPHVGEDEAMLAALMRHAALGETAAALACAGRIARPEAVEEVVGAAAEAGRMILLAAPTREWREALARTGHARTLH